MRYQEVQVPLREYVQGVLPNEWYPSWDEDSLKAGAVAVKNFAVAQMLGKGYVWDCTYDQVYDPKDRTPQTDRAVNLTMDWWLIDDDTFAKTYYNAFSEGCSIRGEDQCMSQWGSQLRAEDGMSWDEILALYYDYDLVWLGNTLENRLK